MKHSHAIQIATVLVQAMWLQVIASKVVSICVAGATTASQLAIEHTIE